MAAGNQGIQRVLIGGQSLTLPYHGAIPGKPEGFQRAQNGVGGAGHFAWWVQVFDAQQPLAALAACVQIAAHGGGQ